MSAPMVEEGRLARFFHMPACDPMEIRRLGKQITLLTTCTRLFRHSIYVLGKDIQLPANLVKFSKATHLLSGLKIPFTLFQMKEEYFESGQTKLILLARLTSRVGEVAYYVLQIIRGSKAMGWILVERIKWSEKALIACGPIIGVSSLFTNTIGLRRCRAQLARMDVEGEGEVGSRAAIVNKIASHKLKILSTILESTGAFCAYGIGLPISGHVLLGAAAVLALVDQNRTAPAA